MDLQGLKGFEWIGMGLKGLGRVSDEGGLDEGEGLGCNQNPQP